MRGMSEGTPMLISIVVVLLLMGLSIALMTAGAREPRRSFRRALRFLKSNLRDRHYRYRRPWYLLAGESKSGKTSLLESHGLKGSVKELAEKNRRLNWYFFDDGVVIDVEGDCVLRADGTANHRGWKTILHLLRKYRSQRPLDGLILTIPCADLNVHGELDQQRQDELQLKAHCLYEKLCEAQKILGMRLPVYILITKCDQISGFNSFAQQLPDRMHAQMFGWSNPSASDIAYDPELLTDAFASLEDRLSELQFEIYAERDEIHDTDDRFLFPSAVQSLSGPLRIILDCLFKQSAYRESYLFRGLYFCGQAEVEPTVPASQLFLADLFKRIFSESSLGQPVNRIARSRNRTTLIAQLLTLLIVLVGGGGLAATYNGLARQEQELHQLLVEEVRDLKAIETHYYDTKSDKSTNADPLTREEQLLHSSETRLFEAMASMNARKFGSPFIPSSWFSQVNERLEDSMAAVCQYVIFESLRLDMQRRANSLLGDHPDHSKIGGPDAYRRSTSPLITEEFAASAAHLTHDFQLSLYVEELGEFRVNLERYNRLVGNDAESLDNLRQLVMYLDHAPLPAGFDKNNYLYQRAISKSRGQPIDSTRFHTESTNRVADLIEDVYAGSFNRKGVTYYYLNNIIETEALLRRPEYAWLSTASFSRHSPFHGMTLSAALGELRKALQDLRREEFMSRDSADLD